MKIATIILMSFLALSIFGQTERNGVYIQNGKTTEIDFNVPHSYYSITPSNKPSVLHFSNGLTTQVETNSELLINSFIQYVNNVNTNAERARFGESVLTVSLMGGSAYFLYPEDDTNSTCVVSTPFADIELHRGSYYFVVSEHSAMVIVIDGALVAYGDKKDKVKVSEGHALIITTNTRGILDSKISLSTMPINASIMARYKVSLKEIPDFKTSIMFIRINGKTVGVSL